MALLEAAKDLIICVRTCQNTAKCGSKPGKTGCHGGCKKRRKKMKAMLAYSKVPRTGSG